MPAPSADNFSGDGRDILASGNAKNLKMPTQYPFIFLSVPFGRTMTWQKTKRRQAIRFLSFYNKIMQGLHEKFQVGGHRR
jgi:hypothetical protein